MYLRQDDPLLYTIRDLTEDSTNAILQKLIEKHQEKMAANIRHIKFIYDYIDTLYRNCSKILNKGVGCTIFPA